MTATGAGTAFGIAPDTDPSAEADAASEEPSEEDEGVRPIPDRLVTELTAHRTLALRNALANDPDTALVAALHVLCLKLFYRYALDSCLEIEPKSPMFGSQAPGLADTVSAQRRIDELFMAGRFSARAGMRRCCAPRAGASIASGFSEPRSPQRVGNCGFAPVGGDEPA